MDLHGKVTMHAGREWRLGAAFTLIELILVMTILTIAISVTAPALANFFRGRSLDSEARRLLALTHEGASRAVSEGVPMDLWIDAAKGRFGLEAEPSYEPKDPKAIDFTVGGDMQIEVPDGGTTGNLNSSPLRTSGNLLSTAPVLAGHPDLPRIRFLPDGTISDTSPQEVRLTGRDGMELWLVQSTNRLSYAIRSRSNQNP